MMLSSAGRSQHAAPAASEALGLVDAGLMAGHSFRVGWAPGGRLASKSVGLIAMHACHMCHHKESHVVLNNLLWSLQNLQ